MRNEESLCHTRWECKYHIVWVPKYRRKVLYGRIRQELGEVFHDLARQKDSRILEGHLQPDHIHVLMSIPPKYSVAQVVGFVKGKSAHPHRPDLSGTEEELQRDAFLGTRILCVNRWGRRRGHPKLHPEPGEGGPEGR